MGCGKTTIGKALSERLNLEFIDCDDYLENRFNTTIGECFDISEDYFRGLETQCLKEINLTKGRVISTGGGVVLHKRNIELLDNDLIIFINRPLENILNDVDCQKRPLIKNNKEGLKNIYNERINLYKEYCDIEVLNDKTLEDIIVEILNFLIWVETSKDIVYCLYWFFD